eukprot:COSAG06_NODE_62489_length_265_cov_0.560241_1_plen_36_part_01
MGTLPGTKSSPSEPDADRTPRLHAQYTDWRRPELVV